MNRHKWSEPFRFINDRGEKVKSERACEHCGIIKVTFFPPHGFGLPFQKFYREGEAEPMPGEGTPVCEAVVA